jgi:hypothetical protein
LYHLRTGRDNGEEVLGWRWSSGELLCDGESRGRRMLSDADSVL